MPSRVPLKTLAVLCRQFGLMLEAGIAIRKAVLLCAKKVGHPGTRRALEEVAAAIEEGSDVTSALRAHGPYFPELFLDMTSMAEESGAMPEVMQHLAAHYENTLRLRKEFLSSIAWPAFQLVAAILVIALLIFVLGIVAGSAGASSLTGLVFGLTGATGALIWLGLSFGSIGAIVGAWFVVQRLFGGRRVLDAPAMLIPVVGHCLRCFAIARFSWAWYLTQQTGMPVRQSLEASLKATGNGVFMGAFPNILERILAGDSFTDSLAYSRLFPEDYLEMVAVAEESGSVPEALHRLSPQFEDNARRAMRALTRAASVLVWLCVAGMIIFFVFRFFLWYVGQINDALKF